ncbi:MAG: hypothetical protein Q7S80_02965 [bacterium]|nr:hypothetical protein [bacterium]
MSSNETGGSSGEAGESNVGKGAEQNLEIEAADEFEQRIARVIDESILQPMIDARVEMIGTREFSVNDCFVYKVETEQHGSGRKLEERNISELSGEEKSRLIKIALDFVSRTNADTNVNFELRAEAYKSPDSAPIILTSDFNPDELFDIHFVIVEEIEEPQASPVDSAEEKEILRITERASFQGNRHLVCLERGAIEPFTIEGFDAELTHPDVEKMGRCKGTATITDGPFAGMTFETVCDNSGDWMIVLVCDHCTRWLYEEEIKDAEAEGREQRHCQATLTVYGQTPKSKAWAEAEKARKAAKKANRRGK